MIRWIALSLNWVGAAVFAAEFCAAAICQVAGASTKIRASATILTDYSFANPKQIKLEGQSCQLNRHLSQKGSTQGGQKQPRPQRRGESMVRISRKPWRTCLKSAADRAGKGRGGCFLSFLPSARRCWRAPGMVNPSS